MKLQKQEAVEWTASFLSADREFQLPVFHCNANADRKLTQHGEMFCPYAVFAWISFLFAGSV